MPIALPSFATAVNVNHNGTPSDALVLKTDGTDKYVILWSELGEIDRERLVEFIDGLGGAAPMATAEGGSQTVIMSPAAAGADVAGLLTGTNYTVDVTIDGVVTHVTVAGATAGTITSVLAAIDTQLTTGTVALDPAGNIRIESSSTGSTSSVLISNDTLFSALTKYSSIEAPVAGASDLISAMKTVKYTNGATLHDLYFGLIKKVAVKPPVDKAIDLKVYHDGTTWRRYDTDAAITI